MRARVIKKSSLDFRAATLDTAAGFQWQIAPAVGNGLSQHRDHTAAVLEPQSFSVEWLRVEPKQGSAPFSTAEKMVVINLSPLLEVELNTGANTVRCALRFEDMIAIPAHAVRAFRCPSGAMPAEAVMVIAGDHIKHPKFSDSMIAEALANDVAIDAGGKLARASILPPAML